MASGGVKHSVDCAADSSDLQISQMNSFAFGAAKKKMTDSCFLL
jgi:hypothetical protein